MMSNANVNLVQSLYAAFGRGDIGTIVKAMAPDVTWTVTGRQSDHPLLGTRSRQNGVQEFFGMLSQIQEPTEFAPRDFYPAGDKLFVLGHYRWKMRKSGRTVESDFIHIFTLRDGKVTAFREFTDTAQFAEAYAA
jgi:ketosteroid isomerase-like protein